MTKHKAVAPDNTQVFTRTSKTARYTHLTVAFSDGAWWPITWHKSERTAQQTKRQWEASSYVADRPCVIVEVEVA